MRCAEGTQAAWLARAATAARGRVLVVGDRPVELPIADPSSAGDTGVEEVVRVPDAVAVDAAGPATGRFDTIIAPLVLAAAADPHASLRALAAGLAGRGSLWFVEPTRRPGSAGRLEERLAPWCVARWGLRPDLDVPAMMRGVGLTVVDVERFVMPTVIWPLRHAVAGRATTVVVPPAGGSGPERGASTDG